MANATTATTGTTVNCHKLISGCPDKPKPPPPPNAPTSATAGLRWKVVTPDDLGPKAKVIPIVDCGDCAHWDFVTQCTTGAVGPTPACNCPANSVQYLVTMTFHAINVFDQGHGLVCRLITDPIPDPDDIVGHNFDSLVAKDVAAAISPPNAPLPFTLPVYMRVTNVPTPQPAVPVTGLGYTITMTLHNPHFVWLFDDGDYLDATTDLGKDYPDGTLTHVFKTVGKHTAYLRVLWQVHYDMNEAGMPPGMHRYGEYPEFVRQVNDAPFPLTVVEAHAVLVQ